MAWKFEAGIPLANQIIGKLKSDIITGVYKPGEPFPTVRDLAFTASVNPNTMQKALSRLEEEGLLVTIGTQGRMVTDNEEIIKHIAKEETEKQIKAIIASAKSLSISKDELIEYISKGWCDNE